MYGNLLVRESMGGEILLIGPYKILTGAQLPPLTYWLQIWSTFNNKPATKIPKTWTHKQHLAEASLNVLSQGRVLIILPKNKFLF